MYGKAFIWVGFLCLLAVAAGAADLTTTLFAASPAPTAGELFTPRALAIDGRSGRRYVLDGGLRRVVVFTAPGEQALCVSLPALGVDDADVLPVDPLLPSPALAVTADTAYLLRYERAARLLSLAVVEGPKDGRTVTLPEYATNGAIVLDPLGRVLTAALRMNGGTAELVLAREDADGGFAILDVLKNPCEGQAKGLHLTGIALGAGGRLALGIAQMGDPTCSFVRSWLVQGTLRGSALATPLQTTHRNTLIDVRGKLLDRYQLTRDLAGRYGYPAKPCVPLFTALAFGPGGTIISGGHTLDPFLRLYRADGSLRLSLPRQAVGGQTLATLAQGEATRIFAVNAAGRVDELALDGRVIGGFGKPYPFSLDAVSALAADADGVYAVARYEDGLRLLRLLRDGTLAWAQRLAPPRGMEKAQPLLATLTGERVFIGWRQPGANGLGMVDAVLEDGTRGPSLWPDAVAAPKTRTDTPTPTPLVAGENGRLYVLREGAGGARVQAFSATGAPLQQLPPTLPGVTGVKRDGTLAWAHPIDDGGMIFTFYAPQGAQSGWKRIGQAVSGLTLARAGTYWGWLHATHTLLRLDDTLTVVDNGSPLSPDGEHIGERITALAGDGTTRLYLALPGCILKLEGTGG